MAKSRVVLAMSGGVDSSVAAKLLLDAGYDVTGVFMRHAIREPESCGVGNLPIVSDQRLDHKQGCCSASDAADARRVADKMGIPFYALDLSEDFDRIIDYFVDEYVSGRTPNPCVMCNHWIKFGKLFDYADSINAHYVASGHYAQLSYDDQWSLVRGNDGTKDQSYVLFGIAQELLNRMLLPVGQFTKVEIREMAKEIGLRVADKKDSQEICFVTSGKHAQFVQARRGDSDGSGAIVTTDGTVVGEHDGIERYTIGQRRGLGVALGKPYFVTKIDPQTKEVVLGTHDELACDGLEANRSNWHTNLPMNEATECLAQVRYNSRAVPAVVTPTSEGSFRIDFTEPCHGVAPGQAVVCYDGDRVLGGGWIRETRATSPSPEASGSGTE